MNFFIEFRKIFAILLIVAGVCAAPVAHAQTAGADVLATQPIATNPERDADMQAQERLTAIYSQMRGLNDVKANVSSGVAILSGQVASETVAERAVEIARRVDVIIAVEDNIDRTLSIKDNVSPLVESFESRITTLARGWPLYLIALATFLITAAAGHLIASTLPIWRNLSPNVFITSILAQIIRVVGVLLGIMFALSVLDAVALAGAIAGGAGLIGLAIGFAVRDPIENFIASILLSIRQPFRADDFVQINDLEGFVVRLTSRATILMTRDGNHLRIPNATVYKSVILNYTRNPHRRLTFDLGIDSADNPSAANAVGVKAMQQIDFILGDPKPTAFIKEVGDSSTIITFAAWIDQQHTDFSQGRSCAIETVMEALQTHNFTIPEPIYRININHSDTAANAFIEASDLKSSETSNPIPKAKPKSPARATSSRTPTQDPTSLSDDEMRRRAAQDREQAGADDLLSQHRPME